MPHKRAVIWLLEPGAWSARRSRQTFASASSCRRSPEKYRSSEYYDIQTIWRYQACRPGLFFMRFWFQWIASGEQPAQRGAARFRLHHLGGLTLLAYAIRQRDIVFIVSQATGIFITPQHLSRPPAGVFVALVR